MYSPGPFAPAIELKNDKSLRAEDLLPVDDRPYYRNPDRFFIALERLSAIMDGKYEELADLWMGAV